MSKVVCLCSGGLDSVVMTKLYQRLGYKVHILYIDYANCNVELEKQAIKELLNGVEITTVARISMPWIRDTAVCTGNLKDSMYAPMRNLVFLSMAISFAQSIDARTVAIGAIDTGMEYDDTCPMFLEDMRDLAKANAGIQVEYPLKNMNKFEVYKLGKDLGIDVDKTISCNTPIDGKPCGECPDCLDRKAIVSKQY